MKKVVYVILGIVVIYLLLALIGPKEIKVERQIVINKPVALVKEKLGDFKFFHDQWSPWTEKDPNMENKYDGSPGEIGHHYYWSGNKEVGKGEMTIMGYNGDTLIQNLSFAGEGDAKSYFITKDNTGSTEVTWGMIFQIDFFQRPFMLFMSLDNMVGGDYEKGLAKLKLVLEQMKDESNSAYRIEELNWDEKSFVGSKRTKIKVADMQQFFSDNYPKLGADIGKNKLQPQMAPCALYYKWDEKAQECEVAAVMCLPKGVTMKGWEVHTFPASKVYHIEYYGDYNNIGLAHEALGKYMAGKGLSDDVVAIEEYVTDPTTEKDTTKWLTNLYYLMK